MNAYERWVLVVVRVLDAEEDPRTLADWGREVGASTGTLRSRCAAAGQSAKASLYFARLLRIIGRAQAAHRWDPPADLSSCDPRTVHRLVAEGGVEEFPSGSTPPTVAFFLGHQHIIPSGRALAELRLAMTQRRPASVTQRRADGDAPVVPAGWQRPTTPVADGWSATALMAGPQPR